MNKKIAHQEFMFGFGHGACGVSRWFVENFTLSRIKHKEEYERGFKLGRLCRDTAGDMHRNEKRN